MASLFASVSLTVLGAAIMSRAPLSRAADNRGNSYDSNDLARDFHGQAYRESIDRAYRYNEQGYRISRRNRQGQGVNAVDALIIFVSLLALGSLRLFGQLSSLLPNLFPFVIGILPGCIINFWLDRSAFSRADKLIADTCASYRLQAQKD
jgi:hypothetical protein